MTNAHPALQFLQLLDPGADATFNIETYTDLPKGAVKPKPDPLGNRFANRSIALVEGLVAQLERLNERGAAVYVAVNEFKGQREKANLVRVRGVHADMDGTSKAALDAVRLRLKPTIEVQSSGPGNWHFYWLLETGEVITAEMAEAINRGLAKLGADPAAVDISRLLRLPGFRHMKYGGEGL